MSLLLVNYSNLDRISQHFRVVANFPLKKTHAFLPLFNPQFENVSFSLNG